MQRYFQLGIRDLLWATLVAGLGIVLVADRTDRVRPSQMTWEWREIYSEQLMSRHPTWLYVQYQDGQNAIWDENRGVRTNVDEALRP